MDRLKGLDLLAINSYAGSIVVAADQYRIPIRGSYESEGYGLDIQQANFPKLEYRRTRAEWPTQDLSSTIVVGHPPCAAFSRQNTSARRRGVDSDAFQCTRNLLEYAMKNKAAAVAIESVSGALEGAREEHDYFAQEFKYDLYRVHENAITYGLPQWRERAWFLFLRRGIVKRLNLVHQPVFATLRPILDHPNRGEPVLALEKKRQRVIDHIKKVGISDAKIKAALSGKYTGQFPKIAAQVFEHNYKPTAIEVDEVAIRYHPIRFFHVSWLRMLDPDGYATCLMRDSWWGTAGRNLCSNEYKAIMGYPRSYDFAGQDLLRFLSQGVCPPIAHWVIDQLVKNLTKQVYSVSHSVKPGETADLRIKKLDYDRGLGRGELLS